jgi:hypothetical protein
LDQSSPLSHPTQSPTLAFMGFRWILGRSKGEIYIGSGYLILNLWLNLCFFKNRRHIEKGYLKPYEKEDLVYWKESFTLFYLYLLYLFDY